MAAESPPEGGASDGTSDGVERRDDRPQDSDRDTLRWACRESIPCAVVWPGRAAWGRSFLVDLREGGPRPQLAIAQPVDLVTGSLRPLQAGDSVRLWSARDEHPWHVRGYVGSIGVIEGKRADPEEFGAGPVSAALVRLPYRLLASERRLGRRSSDLRVAVEVAPIGRGGEAGAVTLAEDWISPSGEPRSRGEAHLVELSRRTLTFSTPRRSRNRTVLLPGARLRLVFRLPDLQLSTATEGRVAAVMEWDEQLLHGVVLGGPEPGTSQEEHSETLRRAGEALG